MTAVELLKVRNRMVDIALEAVILTDKYFNQVESVRSDLFEFEFAILDFDDMSIRIVGNGVLNISDNELSAEGERFRKTIEDDYEITYEDQQLHIHYRPFWKEGSQTTREIIEGLDSLLYDLKDSDYEGNIEEINKLEDEIDLFNRILDYESEDVTA